MKQTIEIEVPDGKKAVWKDNKIVFEDIKPPLPKTWEEFCEQNKINEGEYYLDISSNAMKSLIGERYKYMKQTIEIEVPDGKKAVWKENKIIFEDINPQLPKT